MSADEVTDTEANDTGVNDAEVTGATGSDAAETPDAAEFDAAEVDATKSAPADRATAGPFDPSEVPSMRPYVDLGGIKIAPREGLQMRLEVDERQQRVVAVSLELDGSLLQVQAFSAPKTTGMWNQIRADLRPQLEEQGAKVSEEEGVLGLEVVALSEVPAEQGGGVRAARFVGVDGPRWILRGVIMGKAAIEAAARADVIDLFREIVVVRGELPMPPGDMLPLHPPAGVELKQPGGATQA